MKQNGNNFQKWRWAVRVFNLLLIAAFILVIVFNAKEMPVWLIVLISLASVLLLLGGRMFCGYFCPVGLLLDTFWWISKKLHVRSLKRSEKFNNFIRWFKWFFLVFYTVLHFVLGFDPGWYLVVLLAVTCPFIARFWCSFCPVGTVLGICNKVSPMKLIKGSEACISCSSCYHNCPMQSKKIMIQKKDGPTNSGDCIFCGECIDRCPGEGTVSLHLFGRTIYQSRRRKHARKGGIPTAAGVRNALANVYEITRETPCWHSTTLSEKYGCTVFLKREDRHKIRSCKIRGVYNKMKSLSEEELAKGVVCASTGNHALALAYSCSKFGVKGFVFMPETASEQEKDAVRYYGKDNIEVVLKGSGPDEASAAAKTFSIEEGAVFIHQFNDPEIVEGQGTAAYEILGTMKKKKVTLDYVFVPAAGGGLASGIGLYIKYFSPATKVIAAVAEGGQISYKVCNDVIDDVVMVPEKEINDTLRFLYKSKGIVLEPVGALAVAALEHYREEISGKNVCCILSGGNNNQ